MPSSVQIHGDFCFRFDVRITSVLITRIYTTGRLIKSLDKWTSSYTTQWELLIVKLSANRWGHWFLWNTPNERLRVVRQLIKYRRRGGLNRRPLRHGSAMLVTTPSRHRLCIILLQKECHPIMRQQAACLQGRDRMLWLLAYSCLTSITIVCSVTSRDCQ